MLGEYVPDEAPDYFHGDHSLGVTPNVHDYLEAIVNPAVKTGSFPFNFGSYYKPIGGVIEKPAVISGKTILDLIDWANVNFSDNSQYNRTPNHNPDEREYIKLYSRIRGTLGHSFILFDDYDIDEAIQQASNQVNGIKGEVSKRELYDAVVEWEGAPHITKSNASVHDYSEEFLKKQITLDGHIIQDNFEEIKNDLNLRRVADEAITLGETDAGHGFGCQIDRLATIETSDSEYPPGVYVCEIKIGLEWHPSHLMQAEAYRRSLTDDLATEPHALVFRIGPENGDFTVLSDHDEIWDSGRLWELFEKKAHWIYENKSSPYPVALDQVDPR
jgi:hypothetical protein